MHAFLEELDQVHDVAEVDRPAMLQDVLDRAQRSVGASDPAYLHLIRGYAAYHYPELVHDTISVEAELLSALSLQASCSAARFYLACWYFDSSRFEEALKHLRMIEVSTYIIAGQVWRALKIKELEMCCELYLGRAQSFASMLSVLVDAVVATDCDNVPAPTELVRCFEECGGWLCESIGVKAYRDCLLLLKAYITHAGTDEVFRERLSRLDQGIGE